MKKSLAFLLICLTSSIAFSQTWGDDYCIVFNGQENLDHLFIDTLNYPGNIWQIGHPDKTVFQNAYSNPDAIVTDTVNPYPVNDTSVFIIKDIASQGTIDGMEVFNCHYYVNSDTLNDYGRIEFSADMGTTWIDLVSGGNYRENIKWFTDVPALSGNSGGWRWLEVYLFDISYYFDIEVGDTLLYRFSFISDSNPENMDGLMFDDLCFQEFVEGVSEIRFKAIETSIFPNPGSDRFRIDFMNPDNDSFQLNIYDEKSRLMMSNNKITGTSAEFNGDNLKPGVYIYKLTNNNRHERGWGKFIVTE
jgi:hypothetical protein